MQQRLVRCAPLTICCFLLMQGADESLLRKMIRSETVVKVVVMMMDREALHSFWPH